MYIVQPRQPRFFERQASVPVFVHDSSPRSSIAAVESDRQLAVQMPHEIAMPGSRLFETDYEVVMIGKEGPRLQNERVVFRQLKRCIA